MELKEVLLKRRSIRKFTEEPVSQEQQWKKQPNILQYEKYRKQNRKKGVAVV